MGIDFGMKRTGLSVTDPLQIIVQGLGTKMSEDVLEFIIWYASHESIDGFVVGYPFMESAWGDKNFKKKLDQFIADLRRTFPDIPVQLHDERNSSIEARNRMREMGLKKNKLEDKGLLDQASAIFILQEFLGHL